MSVYLEEVSCCLPDPKSAICHQSGHSGVQEYSMKLCQLLIR